MIRRALIFLLLATPAAAQAPAELLPAQAQITAAVLPAPAEFRDDATVWGYDARGGLTLLRRGSGSLTCLAPDPAATQFHVACYHKSLEPFMSRGRALRAKGVQGPAVDSVRFREIKSGKLRMPRDPAVLYSLTGPAGTFNVEHGTAPGARALFVIYVPNATGKSLGITERPSASAPWVMSPGTPRAHIMFVPKM